MTNVTFNSVSFQDSNVVTSIIDHESDSLTAEVESVGKYGGRLVDTKIDPKKIRISGVIVDSSQSNLESRIDTLKKNVGVQANLDIDYAGGTRRYDAVLSNLNIDRGGQDLTIARFEAEFIALSPGKSTTATTVTDSNKTADFSNSINCAGSAPPKPTIALTVNSQTALSSFAFTNTTTGTSMSISQPFANADVIIVDCEALTVKKNGAIIDYGGVFPNFVCGVNAYSADLTGTAFNVTLSVSLYPRFL